MLAKTTTPVVAVLLLPVAAFALDVLGPVSELTAAGQFNVDTEYTWSSLALDAEDIPAADITDDTVKDFDIERVGVRLGMGMGRGSELFFRLGVVEADPDRGDNLDNLTGYIGKSDQSPLLGGGARWRLYNKKPFQWDLVAQASWSKYDFDERRFGIAGNTLRMGGDIELVETQIATGPTYWVNDSVAVFGGPFVHLIDGDLDFDGTVDAVPEVIKTDIEQDSLLGAYGGLSLRVGQRGRARVEYQIVGRSKALAVSLGLRF